MSTSARTSRRPDRSDYDDYYHGYIRLVPEGAIVEILRQQLPSALDLLTGIPEEKVEHRYAEGKWTTREVVGHVVDMEWVFTYRALRFARGDQTPLAGVDQEPFMAGANFHQRPMATLVEELRHLRRANTVLFDSFDDAILARTGVASGCPFTVRSLLYVIAGHTLHHLRILEDRYLTP